jgi:uncharacterized protein
METEAERCARYERFKKIDAAFRLGDLDALRAAVDDPGIVPNGPMPLEIGPCLVYAVYHSPLRFIRTLLEIGADSNPADDAGFPPLIAALSCSLPRLGASGRPDVTDNHQFAALIRGGSQSGGINDYTPLHLAVSERNLSAVALLLDGGADPRLRTRIDDCETAREMAEKAGFREIA